MKRSERKLDRGAPGIWGCRRCRRVETADKPGNVGRVEQPKRADVDEQAADFVSLQPVEARREQRPSPLGPEYGDRAAQLVAEQVPQPPQSNHDQINERRADGRIIRRQGAGHDLAGELAHPAVTGLVGRERLGPSQRRGQVAQGDVRR
ncbi:MAG: hypothetical protein M3083_10505 [Actinomycetota bacterium]|nr:hypothetical protein [Actinomycetota bacterium]